MMTHAATDKFSSFTTILRFFLIFVVAYDFFFFSMTLRIARRLVLWSGRLYAV